MGVLHERGGGEKENKKGPDKPRTARLFFQWNRAQFAALSVSLMGDLDVRGELL